MARQQQQPTPDPWVFVDNVARFNEIQEHIWNVMFPDYCRDKKHACAPSTSRNKLYRFEREARRGVPGNFQCRLVCARCAYVLKDRARKVYRECNKRTCTTLPFCMSHLKRLGLVRKRSDDRGFGLFATKFFPKGAIVCFYTSESISAEELERRYPRDSISMYAFTTFDQGRPLGLDAACYRGAAGNVNEFSKFGKKRTAAANVSFEQEDHSTLIKLIATRDIQPGEEIFGDYGMEYDRQHYRS